MRPHAPTDSTVALPLRAPVNSLSLSAGMHDNGPMIGKTVVATFAVLALLAVLGLPLWIAAVRRGRTDTIRRFAIAGLVLAIACGVIAGSSDRLISQCEAAGYPNCVDPGAAGMQLVMIGIYAVAAWIVAIPMWRD